MCVIHATFCYPFVVRAYYRRLIFTSTPTVYIIYITFPNFLCFTGFGLERIRTFSSLDVIQNKARARENHSTDTSINF